LAFPAPRKRVEPVADGRAFASFISLKTASLKTGNMPSSARKHDLTNDWYLEGNRSYRAFYRFGRAEFTNGGLVLGSGQFSILPQLPVKILLDSKVFKIHPKIIISLC